MIAKKALGHGDIFPNVSVSKNFLLTLLICGGLKINYRKT